MDFLALLLMFVGAMSFVTAVLVLVFPGLYRNRRTGELPDRKRRAFFCFGLGSTCFLAVILITHHFL